MTRLPPEVARIVREQERQLALVAPRHIERLVEIARAIIAELEVRMRGLVPGRWTTAQTKTVLLQLRALIAVAGTQYGVDVGEAIGGVYEDGAAQGRDLLERLLAAWDGSGLLATVPTTRVASELLDPGLLEMKEASVRAYGTKAIEEMRAELTRGSLAGETIVQTWERLGQKLAIPDWKAERIARTEQSYALHRRQLLDLEAMFGAEEARREWRKQLVATLDDRTGDDSVFVNGQVRELDALFDDNEGRHYPHPPNRPNDREAMVFVPATAVPGTN